MVDPLRPDPAISRTRAGASCVTDPPPPAPARHGIPGAAIVMLASLAFRTATAGPLEGRGAVSQGCEPALRQPAQAAGGPHPAPDQRPGDGPDGEHQTELAGT